MFINNKSNILTEITHTHTQNILYGDLQFFTVICGGLTFPLVLEEWEWAL